MDIKHLTHIVALADKRNFARAAEQINLSQPALTRSIQAVEAELGMQLFDRGTTEVTPTAAGDFLLERARRLVFDSRCLKRDMDLYRDAKIGDTAFGVGPFPTATFLAPLLVEIRKDFPEINLRVVVGNWEMQAAFLREESIEFFIAHARELPREADLSIRPLHRELGGLFVRDGHPLIGRSPLSLKEVWTYGVASVRLPMEVRSAFVKIMGLPPESSLPISLECDDIETLKRVALTTDTVLASTLWAVSSDVSRGALVPLSVDDLPAVGTEMGIVTLRGRTSSPMAGVIQQRLKKLVARA